MYIHGYKTKEALALIPPILFHHQNERALFSARNGINHSCIKKSATGFAISCEGYKESVYTFNLACFVILYSVNVILYIVFEGMCMWVKCLKNPGGKLFFELVPGNI